MISEFTNFIVINNKQIKFTELKVKHLKIIYKCLIGEIPDPKIVFYNLNNILCEITSLSNREIEKLNFIDYFTILLELRRVSIGNSIFVELTETKNVKIEVDIQQLLNKIPKYKHILVSDKIHNLTVQYRLPSISEVDQISENKQPYNFNFYKNFISQICINNKIFNLYKEKNTNIETFLNRLPARVTSAVIKKTLYFLKETNINLFTNVKGLENRQLFLNCNIINLIYILKFIFGEQLLSLYDNIFALCKIGNFSPEYIENCTPGEYILFIKRLEQLTAKQNIQSSETTPIDLEVANSLFS
jgi:hypothetical protein